MGRKRNETVLRADELLGIVRMDELEDDTVYGSASPESREKIEAGRRVLGYGRKNGCESGVFFEADEIIGGAGLGGKGPMFLEVLEDYGLIRSEMKRAKREYGYSSRKGKGHFFKKEYRIPSGIEVQKVERKEIVLTCKYGKENYTSVLPVSNSGIVRPESFEKV